MKKKIPKFKEDPVVAEVRAARAKLVKKAGGTVEGFMALIEQMAAERKARASTGSKSRAAKPKKPSRRRAA